MLSFDFEMKTIHCGGVEAAVLGHRVGRWPVHASNSGLIPGSPYGSLSLPEMIPEHRVGSKLREQLGVTQKLKKKKLGGELRRRILNKSQIRSHLMTQCSVRVGLLRCSSVRFSVFFLDPQINQFTVDLMLQ